MLETRPASVPPPPNADLDLAFDFWQEGGVLSCTVRNLTDHPLYLDLSRTQLIINGLAHDYYADEQTTATSTRARAVATWEPTALLGRYAPGTAAASLSSSRTLRPKPVLQVPPQAAVVVGGLSAVPAPLLACELNKWKTRTPATLGYSETTSPLRFRQFLTYSAHPDGHDPRTLDHGFWVERVSNMSAASFRGPLLKDERCGRKLLTTHPTLPYAKRGNLYVAFRPVSTL